MALADREDLRPVSDELDCATLQITGELPGELNGTLYRNGPNPQFDSPGAHWFAGDGMVHAFAFDDGRVDYRNRWVRTAKWSAERDAGRALFSGFGGNAAPGEGKGGTANTNIVSHAGRLLALEEGHAPIAIDPASLGTDSDGVFGPHLSGPFTAHPKTDPVTGELLFFGYNASGPFSATLSFGIVSPAGALTFYRQFAAPYASMVHDFIVTEGHVVFPVLPLTGSLDRARSGRPPYAWEPERGAYLGILPRANPEAGIRWIEMDPCYVFHFMNAWEEQGSLHADLIQYDEPPLFPRADGTASDPGRQSGRLCRWSIDLAAGTVRRHMLGDEEGEFPRIDDRRAGLKHRHGWLACASARSRDGALDELVHVDFASGIRSRHFLGTGAAASEPVFVPRSGDSVEGDGFILSVVWDGRERRSSLQVFDALNLDAGPIASVAAPRRIPAGFHGNWVAAA